MKKNILVFTALFFCLITFEGMSQNKSKVIQYFFIIFTENRFYEEDVGSFCAPLFRALKLECGAHQFLCPSPTFYP